MKLFVVLAYLSENLCRHCPVAGECSLNMPRLLGCRPAIGEDGIYVLYPEGRHKIPLANRVSRNRGEFYVIYFWGGDWVAVHYRDGIREMGHDYLLTSFDVRDLVRAVEEVEYVLKMKEEEKEKEKEGEEGGGRDD